MMLIIIISVLLQIIVLKWFTKRKNNDVIKCKYIKKNGSSCSLNNNCKYPFCEKNLKQ